MQILERTDRLPFPLGVDNSILQKIREADNPQIAADIVATFSLEDAVAIIDNLDQLTAAFVLNVLRAQGRRELMSVGVSLCFRADELKIRGSAGLCYARDLVFQETGYLFV